MSFPSPVHTSARFLADMRGLMNSFDGAFLKLAETQHALDTGNIPVDQFLATAKMIFNGFQV